MRGCVHGNRTTADTTPDFWSLHAADALAKEAVELLPVQALVLVRVELLEPADQRGRNRGPKKVE